ncbi:hypothetical protein [Kineosporia babensis]|uniref:Uncharacterized protein n=1 Tax=Kineosporia babensis TaxID=499548 RepID=A0A9X1NCX1_9ACTN|nr:hypothetical protein [Kineosporia babensis]MCD5311534.1 hypothetical protein [Kineosporia babensis]
MARLLIISRSLALGMRLTDLHEVDERAADELEEHLPGVEGFDVLVLDVGDPVLAVNTVNSLREEEQAVPVMLISGYQPEWEQVEAQQVEGVHVVPLPITRQALLRGVAILMDEDPDLISVEPTGNFPALGTGPADSSDDATVIAAPTQPVPTDQAAAVQAEPSKATPAKASAPKTVPPKVAPVTTGPTKASQVKVTPATTAAAKAAEPTKQAAKPAAARPVSGAAAAPKADGPAEKPAQADDAPAKAPGEKAPGPTASGGSAPGPNRLGPSTGTLGQQMAARRLGQNAGLGPQHDRARRPGARPAPEAIQVTPSPVAGLSYSSPVARPFSEQPPTGQFPFERALAQREAAAPASPPPAAAPASPLTGRQSRWRSNPAPETGSISMDSSNIAANRRLGRIGDRPRKLQRRPSPANPADAGPRTPGRGLVTDPLGPRTDPYGFPVSALERRLDAEAASAVNGRSGPDGEPAVRTLDLIRQLHERSGELYGVSDTSQVLADDVLERASADAAAVLVPDGEIWRVSGGVGLRPMERRLELTAAHWLITEVGGAGRAILVDDTDIVRQQLAGAPLAAWRHLMAVPVPDVRVIVVLARKEEGQAFTGSDLIAVHPPVRDSAVLLAQAIETRRLARALSSLREPESETGRPGNKS